MAGNKFDNSPDPAFEDALLAAAAAAAPPVAAAAAIVDQAEELLEAGNDAAKFVGGALDDLFGGGDDVPPDTSTFPVDPNAPIPTETPGEANARGDDIRANQAHFNELGGGGGWVFNADPNAHTQVDNSLDLESGIAGPGAVGGNAVTAPDGAFEPVSESAPHTGVGFIPDGTDIGAPDGAFEPASASESHTSVAGADAGAPDGVFGPVGDSDPHTSVAGAGVGAPDGAFEPVAESDPHTTVGFVPAADDLPTVDSAQTEVPVGSDVQLNPQPIPPGMGADIGETVVDAAAASAGPDVAASSIIIVGGHEAAVGADLGGGADAVSLNPQPIPPGIDLHPPGPIAPADAEVSLNPQPIPPEIGADIGEPVTEAAASAGPDVAATSIIIVGGTEPAVVSDVSTASVEAPVVADIEVDHAPMEDVASTIAVDDGPLLGAAGDMHAPIEEHVFADDPLDG